MLIYAKFACGINRGFMNGFSGCLSDFHLRSVKLVINRASMDSDNMKR